MSIPKRNVKSTWQLLHNLPAFKDLLHTLYLRCSEAGDYGRSQTKCPKWWPNQDWRPGRFCWVWRRDCKGVIYSELLPTNPVHQGSPETWLGWSATTSQSEHGWKRKDDLIVWKRLQMQVEERSSLIFFPNSDEVFWKSVLPLKWKGDAEIKKGEVHGVQKRK